MYERTDIMYERTDTMCERTDIMCESTDIMCECADNEENLYFSGLTKWSNGGAILPQDRIRTLLNPSLDMDYCPNRNVSLPDQCLTHLHTYAYVF